MDFTQSVVGVVWYLWQAGFIPWGTCRNAVIESFIIVFRSFISIIHLQGQPGSQDLRVLVREVGVGVYGGFWCGTCGRQASLRGGLVEMRW